MSVSFSRPFIGLALPADWISVRTYSRPRVSRASRFSIARWRVIGRKTPAPRIELALLSASAPSFFERA